MRGIALRCIQVLTLAAIAACSGLVMAELSKGGYRHVPLYWLWLVVLGPATGVRYVRSTR